MEILAVLDDLLFSSKITGSLEPRGHSVRILADPAAVLTQFRSRKPGLVIVDLGLSKSDPFVLIRNLKKESEVPILAYTSHVDISGQERAREAGADKVVTRSSFSSEMQSIVGLLAP